MVTSPMLLILEILNLKREHFGMDENNSPLDLKGVTIGILLFIYLFIFHKTENKYFSIAV
jgi:hypothetical protein